MSNFNDMFKAVAKSTAKDKEALATVHRPGDITIKSHIPWGIPTGLPELDFKIGRPGWPAGRCVELYGFEHCGKTTLGYHAIAQAQRMGGGAWFIDTEKSWDEDRAYECGVNVDGETLGLLDADSIDATFRSIQRCLKARKENNDGKPLVIVIDSITGTATEAMRAKTIGEEERVAQDAKAIRGGMRRIGPDVAELNVNLFMINHATANITANKYAKQSDSSGGHSIKLAASVRCAMKSAGWIKIPKGRKNEGMRLGQKISLTVEKLKGSRMSWPEVKETVLLNTVGFDLEDSLLKAGCQSGWIGHKHKSQTYTLGEDSFPIADWHGVLMGLGGPTKAYAIFIDWCMEEGLMSPWGQPLR
jgi:recombination protein RecA